MSEVRGREPLINQPRGKGKVTSDRRGECPATPPPYLSLLTTKPVTAPPPPFIFPSLGIPSPHFLLRLASIPSSSRTSHPFHPLEVLIHPSILPLYPRFNGLASSLSPLSSHTNLQQLSTLHLPSKAIQHTTVLFHPTFLCKSLCYPHENMLLGTPEQFRG